MRHFGHRSAAFISEAGRIQTGGGGWQVSTGSDPAVHADQSASRRLGRRYAELTPIVATARDLESTRGDLEAARELSDEDPTFADEARVLATRVDELEAKLAE